MEYSWTELKHLNAKAQLREVIVYKNFWGS